MKLFLFKIFSGIRNLLIDIRFGQPLFGYKKTNTPGHLWIVNTDYSVLPHIFSDRISESDVIVDIGCGRGRVINYLLFRKYKNKIIGIEYDQPTASKLKKRMARYKNVNIIYGDAIDNIPKEATVFYLFNPFEEKLMIRFRDKLKELFRGKKNIMIIYYRPLQLQVFENDTVWSIEEFEIPQNALDCRYDGCSLSYRKYAVICFCQP